ncbi:hypothetical protein CES86_0583 [Brucella lupini]|uniref:Uncharacterized protein n=1 Tax=Brucella lupini TaxID=255457 RepID=A0A256GYY5_9HYPH|nr:hypothetical protein CES86_0583 [Brucella lupini]
MAAPAATWSLSWPAIFLAIAFCLFNLPENPAFSINAGNSGSRLTPAELAGSSVVRSSTTG